MAETTESDSFGDAPNTHSLSSHTLNLSFLGFCAAFSWVAADCLAVEVVGSHRKVGADRFLQRTSSFSGGFLHQIPVGVCGGGRKLQYIIFYDCGVIRRWQELMSREFAGTCFRHGTSAAREFVKSLFYIIFGG